MKQQKFIKSFPALDIRHFFSRNKDLDPVLGEGRLRLYASARAALYRVVESLNLSSEKVVLLPSYHCGVEVEAVLRAGCEVDFYRINPNMTIDFESLLDKINNKTKAILITHFFGFPQNISSLLELCRKKNIFLIEDCAHALYSKFSDGEWLGTKGDFSIFSMRKTIFLPNGGAVRVNRNDAQIPEKGNKYFEFSFLKNILRSILEYEKNKDGNISVIANKILKIHEKVKKNDSNNIEINNNDNRWYYDVPIFDYKNDISAISLFLSGKENYKKIIDVRRRNYLRLIEKLRNKLNDNIIFPKLDEGVCPLCFPLLVKQRDAIVLKMIESGVEPFVFGRQLHPRVKENIFPEAKYLSDNILGLPVHQQLSAKDIETISEVAQNIL